MFWINFALYLISFECINLESSIVSHSKIVHNRFSFDWTFHFYLFSLLTFVFYFKKCSFWQTSLCWHVRCSLEYMWNTSGISEPYTISNVNVTNYWKIPLKSGHTIFMAMKIIPLLTHTNICMEILKLWSDEVCTILPHFSLNRFSEIIHEIEFLFIYLMSEDFPLWKLLFYILPIIALYFCAVLV